MTRVSDIIERKGGMVMCVEHSDNVFDAISLMSELNIGAVLVRRQGVISGIFTERDYLQRIALQSRSSRTTRVEEVMSAPVISAEPGDTIEQCLEVMTNCRCRHLPVVADNELLGIISIGDLVKSLLDGKESQIRQLSQYISGSY